MQISLMLGNLGQPFEEAIATVQRLGLPAIHLSADGRWAPETCGTPQRKELKAALRERGLVISALSRWGGDIDLGDAKVAERGVADARQTLEMAADVMGDDAGMGIWQAHIGVMPRSMSGPRWDSFLRSAEAIVKHGEKVGACLAVETGPEPAAVMEKLMSTFDSPALRVNYDPANLILWP
ncbi:MAG TPA: TIM barrel protein, partial [Abditibacteriaceae bacterium]|nr:TIM barrel protein [Abditibacteriaceae bacterium]